jgi:hypothetical protein
LLFSHSISCFEGMPICLASADTRSLATDSPFRGPRSYPQAVVSAGWYSSVLAHRALIVRSVP